MPACRLAARPLPLERFDVIGEDTRSVRNFVRHVGLSLETRDGISHDETVAVGHMGPPIENPGEMLAHSVGSATLTVDDAIKIELCLDEVEAEYDAAQRRPAPLQQYVIVPHVKPWRAKDGTILWHRYSCAGLVIESYGEAGIKLVDDSNLPDVDLKVLDQAYPDLDLARKDRPIVRKDLGIPGKGPWQVVLAGYVLHALNRTKENIQRGPYSPSKDDKTFP